MIDVKKRERHGNTEIKEILHDALRYPSTSWKNVLILGVIAVFTGMAGLTVIAGIRNYAFFELLLIIGFLIGFLVYGYLFRIMKSSFAGSAKLPKFNSLSEMYLDGIKVFIVNFIYTIPSSFISFGVVLLHIGILKFIADLYMIIVIPVILMALTNATMNDDKFSAAFKFREIFNKMRDIGWLNIIKWYIATGILLLIIAFIGSMITMVISMATITVLGFLILFLTVVPYLAMYLYRSAALFYMYE